VPGRAATDAEFGGRFAGWRAVESDGGIGAAMVDLLLRQARELGCVRVVLSPSERSVPFYERARFGPATMLMATVL
jgi:predicted N-acetyltransferase YhbS